MRLFVILFSVACLLANPLEFEAQTNIIKTNFYSKTLGEDKAVDIYIPPGYEENTDLYYPVIYYLHGWNGGSGSSNPLMFHADSLIREGLIDPIVIVAAANNPEPFQGSFYMYSPLWGDYETFNVVDLIQWIQEMGRAMPLKGYRALIGQSMGGYGCFRLGIIYDTMFRAIAAHGAPLNYDLVVEPFRQKVLQEAGAGAPFFYDFSSQGTFTQLSFGVAGAFSPNLQSPQEYISPRLVDFPLDESGQLIDSTYLKWKKNDPVALLDQLSPADSLAILFGAGENDELLLYPPNLAFQDSLERAGFSYTFFSHPGTHSMPEAFMDYALKFIDSILPAPLSNAGLSDELYGTDVKWSFSPNPVNALGTVNLETKTPKSIILSLLGIYGEENLEIFRGELQGGLHKFPLDVTGFPSGVYFLRLHTEGLSLTKKVIIK